MLRPGPATLRTAPAGSPARVSMESATSFPLLARQWPGKAGTAAVVDSRCETDVEAAPPPQGSQRASWRRQNTTIWISRARRVSASSILFVRFLSVCTISSSGMTNAAVPALASIQAKARRTERAISSCVPPDRIPKTSSVSARTRALGGSVFGPKRTSAGQKRRRSGPSSLSGQPSRTPWRQARSGSFPDKHPRRPTLRLRYRRHECV